MRMKKLHFTALLVLSAFLVGACQGPNHNSDDELFPDFPDVPRVVVEDGYEQYLRAYNATKEYEGPYAMKGVYLREEGCDVFYGSFDGEGNGYVHEQGGDVSVYMLDRTGTHVNCYTYDEGEEHSHRRVMSIGGVKRASSLEENILYDLDEMTKPYYLLADKYQHFFETYEMRDYDSNNRDLKVDSCTFEAKTEKEENGDRYFSTIHYVIYMSSRSSVQSKSFKLDREIEIAYTETIERIIINEKTRETDPYNTNDDWYTQTYRLRTGIFDKKGFENTPTLVSEDVSYDEETYDFYLGDYKVATVEAKAGESMSKISLYNRIYNNGFVRQALDFFQDDMFLDPEFTKPFEDVEESYNDVTNIYIRANVRPQVSVYAVNRTTYEYHTKYDFDTMTPEDRDLMERYNIPIIEPSKYSSGQFSYICLDNGGSYDISNYISRPNGSTAVHLDCQLTSESKFDADLGTIHKIQIATTEYVLQEGEYMEEATSLEFLSIYEGERGTAIPFNKLNGERWFKMRLGRDEKVGAFSFKLYYSENLYIYKSTSFAPTEEVSTEGYTFETYILGERVTEIPAGFEGDVYFDIRNISAESQNFLYLLIA